MQIRVQQAAEPDTHRQTHTRAALFESGGCVKKHIMLILTYTTHRGRVQKRASNKQLVHILVEPSHEADANITPSPGALSP